MGGLWSKVLGGLAVAAGVTILFIYGASVIFSGGATAPCAPYVVGGLAGLGGYACVMGQANRDIRRGEISSGWDYVLGGAGGAGGAAYGAAAGGTFCLAPYGAEVLAASAIPPVMAGISVGGMFHSGEAIMDIAVTTSYSVTFSNVLVTANDFSAYATGTNVMNNTLGQENYESVKYVSKTGSDTIFWSSLANPRFYGTNNNVGNIRQNAMYDNSEGGLDANLLDDMGKFADDTLENNYQVYVNRKISKGQTPKDRLEWKKASDY